MHNPCTAQLASRPKPKPAPANMYPSGLYDTAPTVLWVLSFWVFFCSLDLVYCTNSGKIHSCRHIWLINQNSGEKQDQVLNWDKSNRFFKQWSIAQTILSTRSRVISSYQGDSIIFHNEFFLQLQGIVLSHPPFPWSKQVILADLFHFSLQSPPIPLSPLLSGVVHTDVFVFEYSLQKYIWSAPLWGGVR